MHAPLTCITHLNIVADHEPLPAPPKALPMSCSLCPKDNMSTMQEKLLVKKMTNTTKIQRLYYSLQTPQIPNQLPAASELTSVGIITQKE